MSDPAEAPPAAERIEVSRVVPASPAEVFAVLRDPQGHVDIDALSVEAKRNYLFARAMVGREFTVPVVRTCAGG